MINNTITGRIPMARVSDFSPKVHVLVSMLSGEARAEMRGVQNLSSTIP
jgi:hypothetical protein